MWTVYLLLCDQKIIYTGTTNDLDHRLRQHLTRNSTFTKQFSDLKLIHSENFMAKSEAAKREKEIKGWSRKKKISLALLGTSSPRKA